MSVADCRSVRPPRAPLATALLAGLAVLLGACSADDGDPGPAGPTGATGATGTAGAAGSDATRNTIAVQLIGRGRNPAAAFDASAAEIVAYHAASQRAFVVNAQTGTVDVFSLAAPAAPTLADSLDVAADVAAAIATVASPAALGAANSVAVDPTSNTVAVAIEAEPKQNPGFVAFYQASDGQFLAAVQVGALPDMLIWTPDGNRVVVANEGEPNGAYTVDPEGSVSVIDVSGGASTVAQANVATATFTAFNAGAPAGVRVFGPGASVAQDLEPEYVAVSADSSTAWVTLQENNAFAVVNLATATVTDLLPLGVKDHRLARNAFDGADRDNIANIRTWPVFGIPMPDAVAAYAFNGRTYLVTANEGDAREYFDTSITDEPTCDAAGGFDFDAGDGCLIFTDQFDIGDLIDAGATIDLPNADVAGFLDDFDFDGDVDEADLDTNASLRRLAVTTTNGEDTGCDITDGQAFKNGTVTCEFSAMFAYGARSFSIYDAATGQRVFDSGSDFETITAERLGDDFNSDHGENDSGDDRSDAKGPEPEAVELATIDGRTYAFIGLERVGGIFVYDVSVPEDARFVQYINSRDFTIADVEDPGVADMIDLGPESIEFVPAADSPTGTALLLVAHEVSGTLAVFEVDSVTVGN